MGIKTIKVPICDKCRRYWLPNEKLRDGSPNPARTKPELAKRCGFCKSPMWNYKHQAQKK